MKIFRDLELHGDAAAIAEARRRLAAFAATPAWERDDQILKQVPGTDATAFRYRGGGAPDAFVWLTWEPDEAEVSNIVPATAGSLTYDQYNAIAQWFAEDLLKPALGGIGALRIELGPVNEDIDDLVGADTATALKRFSRAANKATGAAHPHDAERWNAFLIHAHMEDAELDPETLHRWLCENDGWDDEQANRLAIQYEQGRELLRQYDEERKP